ncbi:MAG: xanthine dehydrogenase family protein molybdopterin-binding subunit [Actinomycetia bacterium]|nr:xanthine dehydrogenase family protein molybdopterin-binding subunit [Actinomycetes bacterium]
MSNDQAPKIDQRQRMLEAFDNKVADPYPLEEYRSIGRQGVLRTDGREKATGAAKYTLDVQLPGMLYARFLTSPYPHAAIVGMDTSEAEKLPGVRCVLRYDDPELAGGVAVSGHELNSVAALPRVAHFQGEECGAYVVADSEEIAENALRTIKVEWEQRPFLLDVEKAIAPGAPLTNPEEFPDSNLWMVYNEGHGDVEKGFAQADKVIEFKWTFGLNTWAGPERPCGVWRWNGDFAEVWVKQQRPHIAKRAISTWFGGIPMSKIDLHCLYQGASFGGWTQMAWNLAGTYLAGLASKRTGRPVKWAFSRREDFYGGNMDAGVFYVKVGFKRDGTITAVSERGVTLNQDMPTFGIVAHLMENTKIPHVRGRTEAAWVNKGHMVPTRCEMNINCYTVNLVFNHVADALGMDPVEVALLNDGAEGHDLEWLNARKAEQGFPVRDSLRECVEKGKAAIGWGEKWHAPGTKKLPNGRMHGLGFTWTHEWDDSAGSSEIGMYFERNDGSVTILGCRADVGVNAETAYCQIAADELGVPVETVRFKHMDDAGFFTMTPDTSTNLSVNGWAVRNAARILKQKLLETAVAPRAKTQLTCFPPAFPGLKPEDLDVEDGVIFEKADPANRMTIADFIGPSGAMGPITSTVGEPLLVGKEGIDYPYRGTPPMFDHGWHIQHGTYLGVRLKFCRQAHFMEVEVDPETGAVDITKIVTVNDVGKVINWDGCEGQAYGGAIMGVGRGLTEEVVYDERTGIMLNGNLLNYKIPTLMDYGDIETIMVETGMGYGPYGTVGIGEDVATVLPALVGPAVHNALGVWIDGFPATPDRVLRALGKA